MRQTTRVFLAAAAIALCSAASVTSVEAQGKGDKKPAAQPAAAQAPKGKKPKLTKEQALFTSRDLLTRNGYEVVRVEQIGASQVIWYRRGNMGRGRGKGPLQKMIVRPMTTHYVVEAPNLAAAVLKELTAKLSWE